MIRSSPFDEIVEEVEVEVNQDQLDEKIYFQEDNNVF